MFFIIPTPVSWIDWVIILAIVVLVLIGLGAFAFFTMIMVLKLLTQPFKRNKG